MLSPVRLTSVCNVRAPYSGGSNFRQYFYGIRYLGHPLTSTENFTEIAGELNTRGVAKYSDFGPIDVEQRAPPIFGRATIRLGIGPHSSFIFLSFTVYFAYDLII